jgi:hypothetical protein
MVIRRGRLSVVWSRATSGGARSRAALVDSVIAINSFCSSG